MEKDDKNSNTEQHDTFTQQVCYRIFFIFNYKIPFCCVCMCKIGICGTLEKENILQNLIIFM